MKFTPKFFNPIAAGGETAGADGSVLFRAGKAPEDLYVYAPRTLLAVNVALATERPLLISGEPGSGKSTLARNAAGVLGWWYYKKTVTSRLQASDLLSTFDALRRLNDANLQDENLKPDHYYIEPGPLWWALNPKRALHRGLKDIADKEARASNPGEKLAGKGRRAAKNKAVILIDEIDKADPDVPNDLLEPLDRKRFEVRETGDEIRASRDVLLILTTNGERELPPAFMRRCVSITLDPPTLEWFTDIADKKFGKRRLHKDVAQEVMRHRKAAQKLGIREPSTGEYLDALEVCRDLKINTKSEAWSDVARSVMWKHEKPPDLEAFQEKQAETE